MAGIFDIALDMFSIDVQVTDVVYSSEDGQDLQESVTVRTIQAAVDPTNRKNLEIIFGGSISDGSVSVVTKEQLYFDDQYASGAVRRQSFIPYQDVVFRVTRSADWTLQTGFYVYLAERHVKQDELI